jgi:hypothetical protein
MHLSLPIGSQQFDAGRSGPGGRWTTNVAEVALRNMLYPAPGG